MQSTQQRSTERNNFLAIQGKIGEVNVPQSTDALGTVTNVAQNTNRQAKGNVRSMVDFRF